jgi:hypothetical protein
MRNNILKALILGSTVCLGLAHADLISFSLTGQWPPNQSALIEKPGETTGWGFTIINNTADYVVIDSSSYVPTGLYFGNGVSTGFSYGSAPQSQLGTYTDYIGPNQIVLTPEGTLGATLHEGYSPASSDWNPFIFPVPGTPGTGVGSFAMYPWAQMTPGSSGWYEDAQITLTYDLYSDTPFGTFAVDANGNQLSGLTTSTFARVVVPEYSALVLLAIMLPLSWWVVRRRKPIPRR